MKSLSRISDRLTKRVQMLTSAIYDIFRLLRHYPCGLYCDCR